MSWARATASIKVSTNRDPREPANLQARKPVPSSLVIYRLLGLLLFYAPHVLAAEIAVCFAPEYGMTPSRAQKVVYDCLMRSGGRQLRQSKKRNGLSLLSVASLKIGERRGAKRALRTPIL
jgi:hypothetical protein